MLEAYYKETANSASAIKPATIRKILKVAFICGALVFFAVAFFAVSDPTSWRDSYTGEPMGQIGGYIVGAIFGFFGVGFLFAAWGSDRLPLIVNGKLVDKGGPKGMAWQISAAGFINPHWTAKTIPWSALDYVQEDTDDYGHGCYILYFTGKSVVETYLNPEYAKDWNPGVGFQLDVGETNVSLKQVTEALMRYNPRLLRNVDMDGSVNADDAGTA
jgi:hypothetical protein